jgi:exodeoxyribonuclease VII small subunit
MSEKKLSYEAARDELTDVVAELESGQSTLEESLKLWERGEVLAKICQEWLDGAKAKLEAAKSARADQSVGSDA